MRQVTVDTVISAPSEEIYDFVADLSRRPAYSDHYLKDYRLARANPVGKGAAARFLLDAPIFSQHGELSITEADRPRRIVEEGRVGRLGRSHTRTVYEFIPESGGATRVELTASTEPKTALDRFKQRRTQRWMRRQSQTALERLRKIFEEPAGEESARATVAGGEPGRGPRFGARVARAR
ncbi:MAG: SRPBCC family protein [Actinomycetota bacterium]|nr:SRPBCC family protein [Actinomycetota bacterium]